LNKSYFVAPLTYAHKKSVVPFAFIGILRSSTTYTYPTTTSNSTLNARLGRFHLDKYSWSCRSFRIPD